jgi:DNA polymerase-3 subunit delta
LRMDPNKVRAFLDQFPEAHLQEALRLFFDTDAKLKGGSGGRPARILEDLLLRLCNRVPATGYSPSPSRNNEVPQPAKARNISNVRTITRGKQTRS